MVIKSKKNNQKKSKKNFKEIFHIIISSDIRSLEARKNKWTYKYTIGYSILIALLIFFSLSSSIFSDKIIKENVLLFSTLEILLFCFLITEYIFRWYTSELWINKSKWSYLLFPFTFTSLIMILSMLPSLYLFNIWTNNDISWLNYIKAFKILRLFRIFIIINLLPGVLLFKNVIRKVKNSLYIVWLFSIIILLFFAAAFFNIEREKNPKINNFFDAIYFSTITLTTIGYGDIAPITDNGRVITIFISITGLGIVAVPSGIIAACFIKEWNKRKEKLFQEKQKKDIDKNKEFIEKLDQKISKTNEKLNQDHKTLSKLKKKEINKKE